MAAFGTLAAGAGGVSSFASDNQLGSASLVLTGALALLVGVTGRVPEHIGREGLGYEPVDEASEVSKEVVSELLDDNGERLDVRTAVAEAVNAALDARQEAERRQAPPPSEEPHHTKSAEILRSRANRVLHERRVIDLVDLGLPPDAEIAGSEVLQDQRLRYDALVVAREGSLASQLDPPPRLYVDVAVASHPKNLLNRVLNERNHWSHQSRDSRTHVGRQALLLILVGSYNSNLEVQLRQVVEGLNDLELVLLNPDLPHGAQADTLRRSVMHAWGRLVQTSSEFRA